MLTASANTRLNPQDTTAAATTLDTAVGDIFTRCSAKRALVASTIQPVITQF